MVKHVLSSLLFLTVFIFLAFCAGRMEAQLGMATLSGTVTDPSRAVIPGAQVTLESVSEKASRATVTNTSGQYVIPAIPPGTYRLVVKSSGFQQRIFTGIVLTSGQGSTLDVRLALSRTRAQVTVSAATPLLETRNATLGTTIPARDISDLPILGGSFLNLISISPGVAPVPPAGSTANFSPVGQSTMPSVYGQRQKDSTYTLDGVVNRDPDLLGVAIYPPPATIAEMKVESGMSSGVYGLASGASVNIVTKSGTNQWHGDAWEYLRNNDLDARSFFLPSVGAYHWNQFGGAIGGPLTIPHILSKQKGWYIFGYYEGVRIHSAANFTALVPTSAQLDGDFAGDAPIYNPYTTAPGPNGTLTRQVYPGNQIPKDSFDASTLKIATALYPAPNLPTDLIPGRNFLSTAPSVTDGNQWSARVDHQFGPKDSFFARYTDVYNPSHGTSLPAILSHTSQRLTNLEISDTHTFGSDFVITARYGLDRINDPSLITPVPGLASEAGTLPVFPAFHGMEIVPPLNINGYTGLSQNSSYLGPESVNSWTADGQRIKGTHLIEFGGGIMHTSQIADNRTDGITFTTAQTSDFIPNTGDGMASFLLGIPETATRNAGNTEGKMHGNIYSLYLQDNWRTTRKLTLNVGLRWDYASPLINDFGLGDFDFETGQYVWDHKNPITGAAANIPLAGIPPDYHNFAPRVGLAYKLTPKTVVRSGYGVYFDVFGSNYLQTQESPRGNWPFGFPDTVTGLNTGLPTNTFPNLFSGPPVGSPTPLGCEQCIDIAKSNSRTPYVQEWTFSIQRALSSSWTLEAAYFGSHGLRLTGQIVDNTAVVPGPGPISARQINPQFPPYVENGYNQFPSWYDGGSLKLQSRLWHGLMLMTSYTYSKTLDISDNLSNASLGGNPTSNATRFNLAANRAVAGFDIPQNFVASFVYALPGRPQSRLLRAVAGGWNVSGIATHYSGLPFSVFLGSDVANIGTVSGRYTQYPKLVGNPHAIATTPQEWFNTAAFVQPAQYTFGDAGRNILRTDSLNDLDFSLYKQWRFLETRDIELRGDFFNLTNAVNFGYPSDIVGTSTFGKISNTRNSGRTVQLALKIHF
ncbi:MAG: carboxypeptidase regulatory-like domain-containing protein [Terriglobia bacterium]